MGMQSHAHRWFSFSVEMIVSKLMKALVGRALRLQEQTSLESLAIQLDEWYRQCAAGYAPEDWQQGEHIEPNMLAE